ncbi:MAG TPA: class I SAM-dependent methyltransferase [Bacteroidia bacterium]|nr:class I SAM-dependent methyltransferase [Bacteroidia bacterium]HMU18423.1 class I SAM-dependent methyltransferase [Bacteroidia bacterium]
MAEFVPSLRFHFLTPFYNFLFGILLPEKKLRDIIINIIETAKNDSLIELGCSTGGLTLPIAKKFPAARIYAVDVDKKALSILERKLNKLPQHKISLINVSASLLPFENKSNTTVVASLLFCNLIPDEKIKTLQEIKRILTNDGHLIIMDWGKPQTIFSAAGFKVLQWVGGHKTTDDLKQGKFKELLRNQGFTVAEMNYINTGFGTLYFYDAGPKLQSNQFE